MEKDFTPGVSFKSGDSPRKRLNKEKETVSPKTNKKLVLLLLLASVFLSWFLWKHPQIEEWWQNLLAPATYEIVNPEIVDEQIIRLSRNLHSPADVVASIQELVAPLQGTYGVYAEPLTEGDSYGLNQNEVFIAASVNKVIIMARLLQEIEKGRFDLNDEYQLRAEDIQDYGTGSMRYAPVGTSYTYDQLLELIGKQSDNTAALVVVNLVGEDTVQALANSLGLSQTSMVDNTATPAEMGHFFSQVYKDKVLGGNFKERFYGYLTRTDFEERIPAGVPGLIPVAHKIGNETQTVNDCGIVFDKKHPYVLCILSKGASEAEALGVLPKISNLVWTFESRER